MSLMALEAKKPNTYINNRHITKKFMRSITRPQIVWKNGGEIPWSQVRMIKNVAVQSVDNYQFTKTKIFSDVV